MSIIFSGYDYKERKLYKNGYRSRKFPETQIEPFLRETRNILEHNKHVNMSSKNLDGKIEVGKNWGGEMLIAKSSGGEMDKGQIKCSYGLLLYRFILHLMIVLWTCLRSST